VAPFSDRTDEYAIYAWSSEELEKARPEIAYAAERFRALFGAPPPRIAVVLFDTRERMIGFDFDSLGQEGLRYLPWLPPAPGAAPAGGIGLRGLEPLSHEAGHVFLMAYADRKLGLATPSGRGDPTSRYGHPALPDWFDEAIATLSESPEIQALRRERLAGAIDDRIPLAELVAMEHPVAAGLREIIESARSQARAEGREAGVVRLQMPAESRQQSVLFYAEALMLGEFLAERGGPAFLARVADGLLEGRSLETIVGEAGILPPDLGEIERAWLDWLELSWGSSFAQPLQPSASGQSPTDVCTAPPHGRPVYASASSPPGVPGGPVPRRSSDRGRAGTPARDAPSRRRRRRRRCSPARTTWRRQSAGAP